MRLIFVSPAMKLLTDFQAWYTYIVHRFVYWQSSIHKNTLTEWIQSLPYKAWHRVSSVKAKA